MLSPDSNQAEVYPQTATSPALPPQSQELKQRKTSSNENFITSELGRISTDAVDLSSPEQQFICPECSKIDFERFLDLKYERLDSHKHPNFYTGVLISNLGTRFLKSTERNCVLCRFFSAVRYQLGSSRQKAKEEYQLRAFSFVAHGLTNFYGDGTVDDYDRLFLAVVPVGDCTPRTH